AVGPQECPETTLGPVSSGDYALLQQAGEIVLGQLTRFVGEMASASDQGVDRIPVDLAQLRQRGAGLGRGAMARGDDPAPVRRREMSRMARLSHDVAQGIRNRDEARGRPRTRLTLTLRHTSPGTPPGFISISNALSDVMAESR